MEQLQRAGILVILAKSLLTVLAGCGGMPLNKTLQAEKVLAAVGFQLKMADTPAKFERISRIPQKRVVRAMVGKREVCLWVDVADCRCYYAGTPQNYKQLFQNRWEEKADPRTDWYQAQHDDPLRFS